MTKNILLITAAIFILTLLGVWVYLLLFSTPTSVNEVFVDLGLSNPTLERPLTDTNTNNAGPLSVSGPLNQLSIKPVAGYIGFNRPGEKIRYAERGTGHIYEINFTTNIETRILGNTVAKTTEAYFSPDGTLAVLVSETDNGTAATMTTIPDNTGASAITTDLPDNIREIKVISSSTVNYLLTENDEGVAYSFNRLTGSATELWRIPLSDIKVWWGGAKTFVVNKPAPALKGAVYEVTGSGQLTPITEPGFAYSALINEQTGDIIETKYNIEAKMLYSQKVVFDNSLNHQVAVLAIPEKCAFSPINSNSLWCGVAAPEAQNVQQDFMKNWYLGLVTSQDYLWSSNISGQKSRFEIDLMGESGLIIDLINPTFNQSGNKLFFQNKIDGTLWLYQVPSTTAPTTNN